MRKSKIHMNARQTQFGLHLARGFGVQEAAKAVGYADTYCQTMAYSLARHPQMVSLVDKLKNNGGVMAEPRSSKATEEKATEEKATGAKRGKRSVTITLDDEEFEKLSSLVVKEALSEYLAGR